MLTVNVKSLQADKLKKKVAELAKLQKAQVKVGFIDKGKYPNGTPIAYVAYLNEYGGGLNPPRPFLKRTVKNHSKKWISIIKGTVEKHGLDDNGVRQAFELAGMAAVGDVKRTIMDWSPFDPRPNAEITIKRKERRARKGKNLKAIDPYKVLVDSGLMVSSVKYEVKV